MYAPVQSVTRVASARPVILSEAKDRFRAKAVETALDSERSLSRFAPSG
jgi:hypothetical protein